MLGRNTILRTAAALLAVTFAAACTEGAAPRNQSQSANAAGTAGTARGSSPELAGAWYEVFFDSNSTAIDTRGRTIVNNVAYVVKNEPTTRVNVIGKTDRVGTPAANMALSQNRATTVRNALIAAGVPATRIDTSWTGETRQEVATVDEASERRNRVVDITVVKMPR
jgi:peptidoglycan-associated lipoprotein